MINAPSASNKKETPIPKPLLLIDVDGPLNPWMARDTPPGYVLHHMRPKAWLAQHPHLLEDDVPDCPVWLHPDHGAELLDLPFDLVWATTWEHDANRFVAPQIGLPELPVITWSDPTDYPLDGRYFKTADIVSYAAGRPFAWIDDELGRPDREYVARHHGKHALLHYVDPAVGLGLDDFEALARWTDEVTAP